MRKWMIMAGATILLGIIVLIFLLFPGSDEEQMTEAEAGASVIELYGGELENTETAKEDYKITFNREDGKYSAQVDKSTGRVEALSLIEKAPAETRITEAEASERALKEAEGEIAQSSFSKERNEYEVAITNDTEKSIVIVDASSGEIVNVTKEAIAPEKPADTNRVITEDEAVKIAKQTLDGEVQELEFVETEDGGYYLIEIENDGTDQEATIQIHAVRGETLTVEWED